jgi:hypothetical protein
LEKVKLTQDKKFFAKKVYPSLHSQNKTKKMSTRGSRSLAGNSESLARIAAGDNHQPNMEQEILNGLSQIYPIYPLNLDAARQIFEGRTPGQGAQHEGDSFSRERLARLQVQIDDYVALLDSNLRNLTAHQSHKLSKQMRDSKEEPVAFQFFRVQQKLMKLSGDHTVEREREMLSKLAALVE